MKYSKVNYILVYVQTLIWIVLLLTPIGIAYISTKSNTDAVMAVTIGTLRTGLPMVVLYLIDFYWLVPLYLFQKRYFAFFGINLVMLIGIDYGVSNYMFHNQWNLALFLSLLSLTLINIIVLGCATGIRYIIRWNDMNTPQNNPEGYRKGSPITYASGLKGNLLLIHGTGDDNVHYQNTELLVNELVKYGKMFSQISYPMRTHGIYEREGTTLHLRKTMNGQSVPDPTYSDQHLRMK